MSTQIDLSIMKGIKLRHFFTSQPPLTQGISSCFFWSRNKTSASKIRHSTHRALFKTTNNPGMNVVFSRIQLKYKKLLEPRGKKPMTKPTPNWRYSVHQKDLPASQGMLNLVRVELKSEMRAGFKEMDARFSQIDARFSQVDARFNTLESEIKKVQSSVYKIEADVARIGILMEEQNSRNQIVLEGLTGLFQRQDRLEKRVDDVETLVRSIAGR